MQNHLSHWFQMSIIQLANYTISNKDVIYKSWSPTYSKQNNDGDQHLYHLKENRFTEAAQTRKINVDISLNPCTVVQIKMILLFRRLKTSQCMIMLIHTCFLVLVSSFIGLLTRLFCRERLDDTKVMVLVVSSSRVTAQLGLLCLKITINTVKSFNASRLTRRKCPRKYK